MDFSKYTITTYFDDIKDKKKFIENINSLQENTSNTIHIIDYEVTTKISHHYLNYNIPLSRNSNTTSIKTNYASYIYYLTTYILIGLNTYEYYTNGEFIISNDIMVNLIEEIMQFVTDVCDQYNVDEQLIKLKQIIRSMVDKETNNNCIKSDFLSNPDNNTGIIIERIENIYDEKGLFNDSDDDQDNNSNISDDTYSNIKDNVVKTLE